MQRGQPHPAAGIIKLPEIGDQIRRSRTVGAAGRMTQPGHKIHLGHKGDARMARHIQGHPIAKGRDVRDTACAGQPQPWAAIVAPDGGVVEIAVGIHLPRPEKLQRLETGQDLGGRASETDLQHGMVQPKLLHAGHAQRRPILHQALSDS